MSTRPRGRPRSTEKRPPPDEALLSAADDLFYREGIPSVGIDALADAAGVSKASIYQHFGNKDGLAAAYIRRRDEHFTRWFLDQLETFPDDSPRARLVATFDIVLRFVRQPGFRGCAFINAATDTRAGLPSAGVVDAVRTHKRRMKTWLAQTADAAGAQDPDDLAAALALLIDGALVNAAIEQSENPVLTAKSAAEALFASRLPPPKNGQNAPLA